MLSSLIFAALGNPASFAAQNPAYVVIQGGGSDHLGTSVLIGFGLLVYGIMLVAARRIPAVMILLELVAVLHLLIVGALVGIGHWVWADPHTGRVLFHGLGTPGTVADASNYLVSFLALGLVIGLVYMLIHGKLEGVLKLVFTIGLLFLIFEMIGVVLGFVWLVFFPF